MVDVMSPIGNKASKAIELASTANELAATANSLAFEASTTAIAQGAALAATQTRLDLMGQLAMMDFCITQVVSFILLENALLRHD